MRYEVWGVEGLPELKAGDDLAGMISALEPGLRDGDILAVTSKAVSKVEGRLLHGVTRDEAVARETVRVVASRGETRIVETRHGFVLAAAGVDASNTEPGSVVLLPKRPAAALRGIVKPRQRPVTLEEMGEAAAAGAAEGARRRKHR